MPILPRRALIAIATTAIALVLVFSFQTPDATITQLPLGAASAPVGDGSASSPRPSSGTTDAGSRTTSPGTTPKPGRTAAPSTTTTASGTLTGTDIRTRFGDVQVQVTLKDGTITDVEAIQLPTHGRSGSISQAVAPMLHEEALQAQSARIDVVSGATYTSEAYAESLQAALDQAHS